MDGMEKEEKVAKRVKMLCPKLGEKIPNKVMEREATNGKGVMEKKYREKSSKNSYKADRNEWMCKKIRRVEISAEPPTSQDLMKLALTSWMHYK